MTSKLTTSRLPCWTKYHAGMSILQIVVCERRHPHSLRGSIFARFDWHFFPEACWSTLSLECPENRLGKNLAQGLDCCQSLGPKVFGSNAAQILSVKNLAQSGNVKVLAQSLGSHVAQILVQSLWAGSRTH